MTWLPPIQPCSSEERLGAVRAAVGELLSGNTLLQMDSGLRRRLERGLLSVSHQISELIAEDVRLSQGFQPPQAAAMSAQANPSMAATRAAGSTIREIVDGINFPTFVQSLITGVFQAIWQSNVQQLEAMAKLLEAVSKSKEQFAATEVPESEGWKFLTDAFSFLEVREVKPGEAKLVMQRGQRLQPNLPEIKEVLGATDAELKRVNERNLEPLVSLARRKVGRARQQTLATLVMMGLNRIVVDRGQLHAEMDMRVDTRSAARATEHSGVSTNTGVGVGGAGVGGAWGVAASASTSINTVQDSQSQSNEEIAATGSLRSFVDLTFHSEPVNMDQMASLKLREQIIQNTMVPDAQYTQGNQLTDHITADRQEIAPAERYEAPSVPAGLNPVAAGSELAGMAGAVAGGEGGGEAGGGEAGGGEAGGGDDGGGEAGGGDDGAPAAAQSLGLGGVRWSWTQGWGQSR